MSTPKRQTSAGPTDIVRVDRAYLDRIDALADALAAKTGVRPERRAVMHAALERGLAALERENGLAPKKKPRPKAKKP